MSDFDRATVRKVAELARLQLTEDETAAFAVQLGQVLKYMEKLGSVDTSKVEPLTHALELATPMRPDEERSGPGAAAMLAPAPEQLHDNYKVPQVLGGEG